MAVEAHDQPLSSRRKSKARQVRRSKDGRPKTRTVASSEIVPTGNYTPANDRPDVKTLRAVRVEHYNKSPEERRASKRSNMTYVSESVVRTPVVKSDVRYVSSKKSSKSKRTRDDPERTHRRRKTRVAEKSHDDSEYVYRSVKLPEERERSTPVGLTRRKDHLDKSYGDVSRTKSKRTTTSKEDSPPRRHGLDEKRTLLRRQSEPISHHQTSREDSETSEDDHEPSHDHRSMPRRGQDLPRTSKPQLQRSKTIATSRSISGATYMSSQPTLRPAREDDEKSRATSSHVRKNSGFFSTLLRGPSTATPPKKVTCLTCMSDDVSIYKSAKLACGHRMCHDCLKRIFTLSVSDPQHMPPRCCTSEHIPLRHVENLFDHKFKVKWNKKFQEYTTRNRIYCPSRGCGEWIKPKDIYTEGGRKYGKCKRCHTKVCTICNGKWHASRDCPKDEETKKFVEVAKKEGWQRCFNCSAMVELKEGCNHMTCRCTAEFCMICGNKWKTCDCPWFNYEAVQADRLNHMNIPQARRVYADGGGRNPMRYQEEIDRRREQERRDEAIARRLQVLGLDDDTDSHHDDLGNVFGIGNAAGHFMNQDFVRHATNIMAGNFHQAQRAANDLLAGNISGRENPLPPPFLDPLPEAALAAAQATNARPAPVLRNHSAASRAYNNSPHTRPSERVVPRRNVADYATEAARHAPNAPVNGGARRGSVRALNPTRRHSAMAEIAQAGGDGPPPVAVDARIERWRDEVPLGEPGPGA